jgi:hypothetical protein
MNDFQIPLNLKVIAIALLVTVATQIFYIAVIANAEDGTAMRMVVWTMEAFAFSAIGMSALALAGRVSFGAAAFGAIALGAMANIIQVGMGLAEFGPAQGSADEAVFGTVLAGAFFLYFHGKAMFGLAAILLFLGSMKRLSGPAKIIGGLSALAGLAALILNAVAMAAGMGVENANLYPAGAAGTASAALLGIFLFMLPEPSSS